MRAPTWRANVAWWQNHLAQLHSSPFYRDPVELLQPRQLALFDKEDSPCQRS
jgi:hypothetical protein